MTSKRLLCAWTLSFLSLVPAARASAAPNRGSIMIGAERLFGLNVSRLTIENDDGSSSISTNRSQFGLFLAPGPDSETIFSVPRLALDFAVADGFTVGGSVGLAITDGSVSMKTRSTTRNQSVPAVTTFLIAPRLGYSLGMSRVLDLWLRGGFTYWNSSTRPDSSASALSSESTTIWGFAVALEPTLVINAFEHFAFTAGVTLDLPVGGKVSTETTAGAVTNSTSVNTSVRSFGAVAGMLVSF